MEKKAVLYIGGGAMNGVFGAGVLTKLQEADSYDNFSHVYGASSGAFNIAYFLSKQTRNGSSIYWEDLTNGFIDLTKLPHMIMDIALGNRSPYNIVSIDCLMRAIQTAKQLNLDEIRKSPVEARVKIYSLKDRKVDYLDLKNDTFQILKEAVTVPPYFFPDGQNNIDGGIIEPIGYDFLRRKHSGQRMIFVVNYNPKMGFIKSMRNSLEGMIISRMFNDSSLRKIFKNKHMKLEEDITKIKSDKNALLIAPPEKNPTNNTTRNSDKLRYTHSLGMIEGQKVLKFIG